MNGNAPFSVPPLSLSASRARKNSASIPTRDYPLLPPSRPNPNPDHNAPSAHPTAPERARRPPIFPPRTSATHRNDPPPTLHSDISAKDLSKNVYLQRAEEERQSEATSTRAGLAGGQINPPLSRRLLGNPESSQVVREEMEERGVGRRAEISKVLFDRKLSKLFEEADFYSGELQALGKDEVGEHLAQLEQLRDASLDSHRHLLQDLNALVA